MRWIYWPCSTQPAQKGLHPAFKQIHRLPWYMWLTLLGSASKATIQILTLQQPPGCRLTMKRLHWIIREDWLVGRLQLAMMESEGLPFFSHSTGRFKGPRRGWKKHHNTIQNWEQKLQHHSWPFFWGWFKESPCNYPKKSFTALPYSSPQGSAHSLRSHLPVVPAAWEHIELQR